MIGMYMALKHMGTIPFLPAFIENLCQTRIISKKIPRLILTMIMTYLVSVTGISAQGNQGDEGRRINSVYVESPITFDGHLSERDWIKALSATGFRQREPEEGATATEKTEVRFLYDDENLYIGIMCHDSNPGDIVHKELRFDGKIEDDDNIVIILDTFNKRREAFFFATNPNGARYDGIIDGNSLRRNRMMSGSSTSSIPGVQEDWNGIWDARAVITEDGWSAELMIPFKTLRFPKTDIQEWGVNFKRDIVRKNEEALWCAWSRNDGIMQLSKTGILSGLKSISRGKKAEFKPYLLGGLEKEEGKDRNNTFKYGLDVKYPLTSDLTLNMTTFTDFAQIEADREQINLTRYELVYPEKRDFFLEGSEIFEFGSRYSNPFYSRSIGLNEDRGLIPIMGGAKVTGKVGAYHIGMINMQTEEENGLPSTNYSVVRVKREIFDKSFIGFIGTNLHDRDGHTNRTYGADFSFRTDTFISDKNLNIDGSFVDTFTPGITTSTAHKRLQISYPNDLFDIFLYHKEDGTNYNPEMGFIRRPGVRTNMVMLKYTPRPNIPGIRKLEITPISMRYYSDLDSRLLTRENEITPIGFETNSGDKFSLKIFDNYEFLDEEFDIFQDKVIPVGKYSWTNYGAELETNLSRPFSVKFETKFGDFYNGKRSEIESEFNVKVNRFLSFTTDIVYNAFDINSSQFDTREYGLRTYLNYSTRLTSKTYIQWNNETREVNVNFRVHYIPKIGSDIYFVYNHLLDGYRDYGTSYYTGLTKIAYMFTF